MSPGNLTPGSQRTRYVGSVISHTSEQRAVHVGSAYADPTMGVELQGMPLPAWHRERPVSLTEISERVGGLDHEAAR